MNLVENKFENKIKTLLSQGKTAWGAALPDASELLAKSSVDTGVDFLWIDTEHRPYSADAISLIPVICRQKGCAPVVRVAGLDPQLIKKALDIGASGVVVPQVSTAEDARMAVQWAKYPPEGTRGISPQWTFFMDVSYEEYLPAANAETCVIVQVETAEGIRNLDAIAAVEGVDVVFAGPLDLSGALGHIGDIGHPEVQRFLCEFPARVAEHGKPSGIALASFDAAVRASKQGYQFIVFGSLVSYGTAGLIADLKRLRNGST